MTARLTAHEERRDTTPAGAAIRAAWFAARLTVGGMVRRDRGAIARALRHAYEQGRADAMREALEAVGAELRDALKSPRGTIEQRVAGIMEGLPYVRELRAGS